MRSLRAPNGALSVLDGAEGLEESWSGAEGSRDDAGAPHLTHLRTAFVLRVGRDLFKPSRSDVLSVANQAMVDELKNWRSSRHRFTERRWR